MVAPRFYIFGVPDGFDMLEGRGQEISYFQRFYDGSTEDTKFTSHRDSNGNVTYTFLKYNLSSGKSRTGSFFGMSLAFSGVYCNHPLRLYELFDYVYHNHILCNTPDASKGILKPIANSDIKAQYLITRFEDSKELVRFIEKVFQHNLATNDELSTSFYPLDPGFKNENQNLVVKLPLVAGLNDDTPQRSRFEESLIGRFREYGYVTISPDWKSKVIDDDNTKVPDSDVEIAPQKIVQWKDSVPNYQRFIIQGLGNLADIDKQVEDDILSPLKKYSYNKNIAPTLQTDYEEIRNQLADLYQKASGVPKPPTGGGDGPKPPLPPNEPSNLEKIKIWVSNHKAITIAGAAAIVVLLLVLIKPKNDDITLPYQYCCKETVDSLINNALSKNDFKKADSITDTIKDAIFKKQKEQFIAEQLLHYHNNLGKEIDKLIDDKKWKDAFVKAEQYFDEDAKNAKIDKIRNACLNDFNTRIEKVNGSNYSSKSSRLKQELLAVKSYVEDENYDSLKQKLDKKQPKEDPKPKTSTYVVEFYKTGVNYVPESNPTQTFKSSGAINVGNDHYIYKIKKDNVYLTGEELKKVVNSGNNGEIFVPKNDHIRLFLKTTQGGSLKIGDITITVEKGLKN